jgi:hypothetical protein
VPSLFWQKLFSYEFFASFYVFFGSASNSAIFIPISSLGRNFYIYHICIRSVNILAQQAFRSLQLFRSFRLSVFWLSG